MAALTPTKVISLDVSAGTYKLKVFEVTPQASGDTVALAAYFSSITDVQVFITAGQDAALSYVSASFSGTDVTITELEQDGTVATDWTAAKLRLWVIGKDSGI